MIIRLKTRELSRYILGKNKKIDFVNPFPEFNSIDSKELREKILSLTVGEARELGINKSTLWYLKKHTQSNEQHRIYKNVEEKLKLRNSLE